MELPKGVTNIQENGTRAPLTVGEAVDAYQVLMQLDPSALGERLTNEVMDVAGELEPVVNDYQRKAQAHRKRCGVEEGEDVTEEQQEDLRDALQNLREEETDLHAQIDTSAAPSIRHLKSLQSIDALRSIL